MQLTADLRPHDHLHHLIVEIAADARFGVELKMSLIKKLLKRTIFLARREALCNQFEN